MEERHRAWGRDKSELSACYAPFSERREGSLPPSRAARVPPPSSEGGKVTSDFWFYHSRNAYPCRTELGRARSPAPTAVRIYFHHSRNACPCRIELGRARSPAPTLVSTVFLHSAQTGTVWLTNRHFHGGSKPPPYDYRDLISCTAGACWFPPCGVGAFAVPAAAEL